MQKSTFSLSTLSPSQIDAYASLVATACFSQLCCWIQNHPNFFQGDGELNQSEMIPLLTARALAAQKQVNTSSFDPDTFEAIQAQAQELGAQFWKTLLQASLPQEDINEGLEILDLEKSFF